MATILCTTNCLPGMLYTSVELCRRLAAAGHRVVYVGLPKAREVVERQGLEFAEVEPSEYPEFIAADSKRSRWDRVRDLPGRRRTALASLKLAGFRRIIERTNPDLLLIDAELLEQVFAAADLGRPIALLNTFCSIWRAPGLPPPHRIAVSGRGWQGSRLGSALLWAELRLGKARRAARQKLERVGCDRLSLLRELARESGVDFNRFTDFSQWPRPLTFRTLPALSLHAQEFEFPHQPPPHVQYVGPMLLENRADPPLDSDEQTRLTQVLARRDSSGGSRKLIFAAFGSFFTSDVAFLRRLFDAVAQRPDWELLVALGGRLDASELGPLPERVQAFRWLPQLEVLAHADAAVSHGGINTVDECVSNAVPMLLYCGFQTDMAGVVSRGLYHGVAVAGDRERDDATAIRKRLEHVLADPDIRRNLESLRASYRRYETEQVAERVIESLVSGEHRGAGP